MAHCALSAFSIMVVLAARTDNAAASGFALIPQSGSGLGNAYAGVAASAEDASTIFYNPAGMANLHGKQLVLATSLLGVKSQFSNSGSLAATGQPLGTVPDNGRKLIFIPNGYFVAEINPKLHIGTGINTPFGSTTEYQSGWIGRYQALTSKLETLNVNPSFSYQMNDALSLGAGMNYQRINGNLSSAVNYAAGVAGAVPSAVAAAAMNAVTNAGQAEGTTTISGTDAAWGYDLGLLLKLSPQTRAGLAYRSTIKYNLSGSVNFSANRPTAATLTPVVGAGAAALVANGVAASSADGAVNFAITMPDNLSASVFHQLTDKWDIMADATWTGWSVFDQLKVVRASGATLSLTQENWKNTWRVAVGANHHYNEQWTARVGLAHDQSPVPDAFRTARIPDSDRTWLSLGGQYKAGKGGVLDFGYAHLFISNSTINRNKGGVDAASTALYAQLAGSYNSAADILSVQYSYGF